MTNMMIAEGDTGVGRFFCGCCGSSFRAYFHSVTTANKSPICLPCIKSANPKRIKMGMPAIPYKESAYLSEYEEVTELA